MKQLKGRKQKPPHKTSKLPLNNVYVYVLTKQINHSSSHINECYKFVMWKTRKKITLHDNFSIVDLTEQLCSICKLQSNGLYLCSMCSKNRFHGQCAGM